MAGYKHRYCKEGTTIIGFMVVAFRDFPLSLRIHVCVCWCDELHRFCIGFQKIALPQFLFCRFFCLVLMAIIWQNFLIAIHLRDIMRYNEVVFTQDVQLRKTSLRNGTWTQIKNIFLGELKKWFLFEIFKCQKLFCYLPKNLAM